MGIPQLEELGRLDQGLVHGMELLPRHGSWDRGTRPVACLPLSGNRTDRLGVDAVGRLENPVLEVARDLHLDGLKRLHVEQGLDIDSRKSVADVERVGHVIGERVEACPLARAIPPLPHEDHAVAPAGGREQQVFQPLGQRSLQALGEVGDEQARE